MAAVFDLASLAWPLLHLGQFRVVQPAESHHLFGAGFLFIGSLMAVEAFAGGVWHRSRARTLLFPAILVFLGWGMIVVTFIEPNARLVHFSMGVPMIAGGWAEARSRLDGFPRKYADILIVSGLVLASLETMAFHLNGSMPIVVTHVGIITLALTIAGLRLYQTGNPASLARSLLISVAIVAIGLDLWVDGFFQSVS